MVDARLSIGQRAKFQVCLSNDDFRPMHSSSSAFDRKCGDRASALPSGILRGLYTLRDGVCVLFEREESFLKIARFGGREGFLPSLQSVLPSSACHPSGDCSCPRCPPPFHRRHRKIAANSKARAMGYRPIDTRWLYSEGTAIFWKAEKSPRISVDQGKCGSQMQSVLARA
jgi:hypothetical protein